MSTNWKTFFYTLIQIIHLLIICIFLKFLADGVVKHDYSQVATNSIQALYWILIVIQTVIKNDLKSKNYDFFTQNKIKFACYFLAGFLFVLNSFFTYIYVSILFGNPEIAETLEFISPKNPILNFWYYLITSTYGYISIGVYTDLLKKKCEITPENLEQAGLDTALFTSLLLNNEYDNNNISNNNGNNYNNRMVETFSQIQQRQKQQQKRLQAIESCHALDVIIQNDYQCYICLEHFDKNLKVAELRCKHTFHALCIRSWVKNRDTCPVCREQV